MNWKTGFILGFGALVVGLSACTPQSTLLNGVSQLSNAKSAKSTQEAANSQTQSFEVNLDEQGRALKGYDPVAYFTDGKAIPGVEKHSLSWQGTEWLFATAENRDQFKQNPEQYAPKNGGYCTFGIVVSKKLDGDPEVWSIINGYLYIFLNEDVQAKFLQNQSGNLAKVVKNWPLIRDQAPDELE